jgi:hypothetical protein
VLSRSVYLETSPWLLGERESESVGQTVKEEGYRGIDRCGDQMRSHGLPCSDAFFYALLCRLMRFSSALSQPLLRLCTYPTSILSSSLLPPLPPHIFFVSCPSSTCPCLPTHTPLLTQIRQPLEPPHTLMLERPSEER